MRNIGFLLKIKHLSVLSAVGVLLIFVQRPLLSQGPTLHTAPSANAPDAPDTTPKTPPKPETIYVTVRKKNGDIIGNLQQKDFTLTEDGRTQTITAFSHELQYPATVGMLIATTGSLRNALSEIRTTADNFVDLILTHPNDKLFVIHFDRQVELLQDVTASKTRLHKAIDELSTVSPQANRQQNGGGQNDGSSTDQDGGNGGDGGGRGGSQRGVRPNVLLNDAIYLAANEIAKPIAGRKALVLISDGVDHYSEESLTDALEAAQRANVIIYAIYIKPQEELGNNQNQQTGSSRNGGGWPGGGGGWPRGGGGWPGGGGGGRGGRGGTQQPKSDTVDGKKVLERISRETGGTIFEATKKESLNSIFKAIDADLSSQYVITYTPDQGGSTNDFKKIVVTLNKGDEKAQTREGYYPAP